MARRRGARLEFFHCARQTRIRELAVQTQLIVAVVNIDARKKLGPSRQWQHGSQEGQSSINRDHVLSAVCSLLSLYSRESAKSSGGGPEAPPL